MNNRVGACSIFAKGKYLEKATHGNGHDCGMRGAVRLSLDASYYTMFRINHESWWKEELPSDGEYGEALRNLDCVGWSVNYIITHCVPTRIQAIVGSGYEPGRLADFLETVLEHCAFKKWFCGHYHQSRIVDGKYFLIYDELRPSGGSGYGQRDMEHLK